MAKTKVYDCDKIKSALQNLRTEEASAVRADVLGKVKEVLCTHPGHILNVYNMYVPPGHQFVHKCPACGYETKIIGPNPLFGG